MEDHPFPRRLGECLDSFGQEAPGDVGLLKIRMARVEDDGDPPADIMIEIVRKLAVPVLEDHSGPCGQVPVSLVEMYVEMGSFEDFPVEFFVLDLVFAEPPRLRTGILHHYGGKGQYDQRKRQQTVNRPPHLSILPRLSPL